MQGIDRSIFYAINHWPESLAGYMKFLSEATTYLPVKIALMLIVLGLVLAGKDTRRGGIQAVLAFPLADGLTNLFKHWVPMPRPFNDPTLTDWILRMGASESAGTASAHAANMMAVAVVFLIHFRWFGVPWLVLAILVGISRVYNGVHYPYQVLLGWTCGAFVALLVHVIYEAIRKKLTKDSSSGDAPPGAGKSSPRKLGPNLPRAGGAVKVLEKD